MEEKANQIVTILTQYGMQLISAAIIFYIGRWAAGKIADILQRVLKRANVDDTLNKFLRNVAYFAIMTFVGLAALAKLGIQTASFIAVLAAAGLAVGMALQGSLANFASGVLLILFKPFRVGDVIEAAGAKGKVEEINIFNTVMNTADNIKIIVPNAQVTSGSIINFSANKTRRVDFVIGVSYGDDLAKAKQVLIDVVNKDGRVLQDPPLTVAVSELADSSVNIVVRPWVNAKDYWDVYFGLTEKFKLALDEANISIPYPQRDLHVKGLGAFSSPTEK